MAKLLIAGGQGYAVRESKTDQVEATVFACDNLFCDNFSMKTESTRGPLPAWRSKSQAARLLGINRRTIQRKVTQGQLTQDSSGRVCMDLVAAIIKRDNLRGRRGPKIKLQTDQPRSRYDWDTASGGLVAVPIDEQRKAGAVDVVRLLKIERRLLKMNAATLNAVAKSAMTIAHHRARLTKLGLTMTVDEMLSALRATRTISAA